MRLTQSLQTQTLLISGLLTVFACKSLADIPILRRKNPDICSPIGRVLRSNNAQLPSGTKLCRDDQLNLAPSETISVICDVPRRVKTFQGVTVFSRDNSCLKPTVSRCPYNSARTCRRVRGSDEIPSVDIGIVGNVINNNRPAVDWKPIHNATQYLVRMSGPGVSWSETTLQPQISYPTKQPALVTGTYTLSVTALSQNGQTLGTGAKTLVLLPETLSQQLQANIQAVDRWKLLTVEAVFQKATILASYQLYDDAIKLTEEALNNDPTAPSLYRLLGNLYSDAGQPQLAQQNYKIAADFARKIADSSEVEKAEVALAQLIASFPQQ